MAFLVAVVDSGSFSAAARRLGVPLSTVSRQVGELESHLKTRLLLRSTRQLSLTEAGQSYLAACRRILEEVGEAERAASGEYAAPKGDLVITAPIVFGRLHVLPVVVAFLQAYPDIKVRLVQSDRLAHLLDDHIDVAVRIGKLPDSSLVALGLGGIRRMVCASPGYFAERGVPASPEALKDHDCITFGAMASEQNWVFRAGKSEISVPIHARLVVNTAEAAIDAASAGMGITQLLSYQIANARQAGVLELALESFEPAPWPVSLVHAGQGLLPLKLRAFLDFARPRLSERLAQVAALDRSGPQT